MISMPNLKNKAVKSAFIFGLLVAGIVSSIVYYLYPQYNPAIYIDEQLNKRSS